MLYDWKLDGRSYGEIEKEAIFHIPREYPEWTSYNASDPGITLIQLLSWLTEVQQYHVSQPSQAKRRKYLKLLGIKPHRMRPAAGAVGAEPFLGLGFSGAQSQTPLLKGTRFFAEDIPFELVEKEWLRPVHLIGACMAKKEGIEGYYHMENDAAKQMKLYPFGEAPKEGNQCCFILDGPLNPLWKTDLYFDICTEYAVSRNPADEGFLPLAKLKWEYYAAGGWKELAVEFDRTYGFLQSGAIRFHTAEEMVQEPQLNAYQIRVALLENDLDVAPLIQNIYLNEMEARQQYTACDYEEAVLEFSQEEESFSMESSLYLAKSGRAELYLEGEGGFHLLKEQSREAAEDGDTRFWFARPAWAVGKRRCLLAVFEREMEEKRIVGWGDEFANQEFDLNVSNILYDDFEILAYDKEEGCYVRYQKAEDFDGCTPEDAVYILDTEREKLLFGDCERGLAPSGEIKMIRLRQSLGSAGNIKAGQIRECGPHPELLVRQSRAFCGGRDEEELSQCFERFCREFKEIRRGITYGDYEALARKAPGLLILNSRVVSPKEWKERDKNVSENEISIVVQPFCFPGQHKGLSRKYKQNLIRVLQSQKMLGTRIRLLDPEYIAVDVYGEILVKPQFLDAEQKMEEAVKEYLDERTWDIGTQVHLSVLYGILDTLPCVGQVKSLSVNARGKGCWYLANGDIGLPPNGLAFLRDLEFCIYTADER